VIGAFPGLAFDELARSPLLANTRLGRRLRETPLGFIDVGSLGGIHPVVDPAASLVQAVCFEPDEKSFLDLQSRYRNGGGFARVLVRREALAGTATRGRKLYVTRAPTNASLLEPDPGFISRYGADKFEVDRVDQVDTHRLDDVLRDPAIARIAFGELIKLDTQGSEHEILSGALRTLQNCVTVICEVEFFQVYRGQKTLSDVDVLLRDHGFCLYGLYPHYRSTKSLDSKSARVEERLMWADAVFFRDPFDGTGERLSERAADCLILCALLTGFLDFAVEVGRRHLELPEQSRLAQVARGIGEAAARRLEADHAGWRDSTPRGASYLEIRRFLDAHYHNGSVDFIAR